MIHIDCEQGSEEWWDARLGIPTASNFDKILTPAQLKPSQSAAGYRLKLLGEWLRGKPDETFQSEWMKRGNEFEQEAREMYQFVTGREIVPCGFCKTDDGRYGASPDGFVGPEGAVEIKCPSPGVHVGYLIDGKIPTTYLLQCAGVMLVCELDWLDFISYHPDLPPLIVRMEPGDVRDVLVALSGALEVFCDKLEILKNQLREKGHVPVSEL